MRAALSALVGAGALFALMPTEGFADTLHGYCAGVGQCIDNGTNSPTTNNPPVNFGFTTWTRDGQSDNRRTGPQQ